MFTADGELREEFRDLESSTPSTPEARVAEPSPPPSAPTPPTAAAPPVDRARDPGPAQPEEPGAPAFFDLVGLLAEPATIYLQEARNADPQTAAQSLELARLHIDLLSVLRAKTEGNLSPSEQAMLDDVVYQLRSGFVGLRG